MNDRNLGILVIADVANADIWESVSQMNRVPRLSNTVVLTPQFVQNTLADMPASACVGFLLWADDLQGLAANVASFASYLKGEDTVKSTLEELGIKLEDENATE